MYRHIREGTGFNTVNVTREAWNTYSVVYPWTGINLEIQVQKSSKFGCFFNIKICIPDEIRKSESLVGLLGSPNANRFDNWMKSDGTVLPFPSTKKTSRFQTAYDYCVDNWCIYHEEESLFTYNKSQEESFDFFYNCGDKYKKDIQSCVEKPPKKLIDICNANEECLIDGCGGDENDAETSLVVEDTFAETKCAKEIFFEDFSGDFDDSWGRAAETGGSRYIGPIGKSAPKIHKEFDVPENAESLTVEFLFYEFDDWNGERGDKVFASVGDVRVDLERFEQIDPINNPNNEQSGKFEDVAWSHFSMTKLEDTVLGVQHKVRMRIPPNQYADGKLVFEFEVEMSISMDKASGGLDNFRIVAHYPCDGDPEEKDVNTTELSLPLKGAGYKGSWKGDPHIMTFDGLKYDCQGTGEFVILKSETRPDFEIQGRFVKFVPERKPTVTKSVVIQDGSKVPRIQVNVPSSAKNGLCTPYEYLNKVKRDIAGLDEGQASFQTEVVVSGTREGQVIYFHESKIQVSLWARKSSVDGCVLSTTIFIVYDSPLVNDRFVGLLGTPNGDKSDDWMMQDSTDVSIPTTHRQRLIDAYDYCVDNWCIRDAGETLFTYDEDLHESFDAFEDCGAEGDGETIVYVEKEQTNQKSELSKICGDDYACYVDGCTGTKEDAQKLIESDNEEADYIAEQDNAFGSPFLRLHNKQSEIFKDITVPQDADVVTLEFLFYEIDQWELDDKVLVYVNDIVLDFGEFGPTASNYYTGGAGGISWKRAEGEFILAQSQDSSFEVLGRFVNFHLSKFSSVLRGLAVRDANVPLVELSIPTDMKMKDSNRNSFSHSPKTLHLKFRDVLLIFTLAKSLRFQEVW
ncbi:Inherit from bactNOG: hemolysin-type calcium-binding region [Seminavis robusta]|uniref:Inherit from bactNOG: hemolysin-type calcium-binding region n=1 Tax=Seminavis robusta TaxID=568900 RepID=A0A9N8DD72_9STRA|nr:Inherit from bactNOG: hemolysin-type calcium-binding region [Seminavis robusta]|eukprot:Sro36_g022820.1 Inherit from bactNOG: hemolysin-type calcium-binding region (855) ;mRNA; r:83839-86973